MSLSDARTNGAGDIAIAPSPARKESTWWKATEAVLDRGSEWLNPILVKEARQALKSWQFVITFTILLACGWLWTLLGVVLFMPGIAFGGGGKVMLIGYFLVLALPLLLVVPFSAFRSLAAEREDGTYELISITALNARQIVGGKLGSAVLQMIVYFSALAPCIAFTYLLRGVDVFGIFFTLYYTFLISLMLSTLALLIATASRARHWQVLLSVLLLLALVTVAIFWIYFAILLLVEEVYRADLWWFWAIQGCIFSFVVSFFVLFLWAAGAQISFPSDNRSTRLRYAMLAQQVLWVGWMIYFWAAFEFPPISLVLFSFGAGYWMLMGAFLIGERPILSPRVKRQLPQTYFGRMFLTWFNPGSGTGYAFAMLNLFSLAIIALAMYTWDDYMGRLSMPFPSYENNFWFVALGTAYVVVYLGLSRLVIVMARQLASVGILFSLLINIFFLVAGIALPLVFQYWLFDYRWESYTELQITNWIWTLMEVLEHDITGHVLVPIFLLGAAGIAFLANLVAATGEMAQVRVVAPTRVLEEDAALRPQPKRKSSPWEDEPIEAELPPGA
jgi:hypothetical protein